jgi:hypothetical protein
MSKDIQDIENDPRAIYLWLEHPAADESGVVTFSFEKNIRITADKAGQMELTTIALRSEYAIEVSGLLEPCCRALKIRLSSHAPTLDDLHELCGFDKTGKGAKEFIRPLRMMFYPTGELLQIVCLVHYVHNLSCL